MLGYENMRRTSSGLSPLVNSCSWFFLRMFSSPPRQKPSWRSIWKNLAVCSSRLELARWPVLNTLIHMSGQHAISAAQNMEMAVVLPKRRGVQTSVSNCTRSMSFSRRMRSRWRSKSTLP